MASTRAPIRFWTDLRFAYDAESLDQAAGQVEHLVEAAERLGFDLELGHTTAEPPVDTE
jgi:hypothetical protein